MDRLGDQQIHAVILLMSQYVSTSNYNYKLSFGRPAPLSRLLIPVPLLLQGLGLSGALTGPACPYVSASRLPAHASRPQKDSLQRAEKELEEMREGEILEPRKRRRGARCDGPHRTYVLHGKVKIKEALIVFFARVSCGAKRARGSYLTEFQAAAFGHRFP